jgi:hypothetical protein
LVAINEMQVLEIIKMLSEKKAEQPRVSRGTKEFRRKKFKVEGEEGEEEGRKSENPEAADYSKLLPKISFPQMTWIDLKQVMEEENLSGGDEESQQNDSAYRARAPPGLSQENFRADLPNWEQPCW